MFLMICLRQSFKSNFLDALATKNPIPLVQFEAIFYLSLSLYFIIYDRLYLSYWSFKAREKTDVFAQLESPHVILTTELKDLYCLDKSNKTLTDLDAI